MIHLILRTPPLLLAFIISFLYWIYLLFTSKMLIVYDAWAYEKMASVIFNQGLREFFKYKPEITVLYPLTISTSMFIAKHFSLSYQFVQKFFQLNILFLTQILTLFILMKLNINRISMALSIFYIGISPALVNSALSLWSEIITYPMVLGVVLASACSWESIKNKKFKKVIVFSFVIAVLFILLVSVKPIFAYLFWLLLLPFFYFTLKTFLVRNKKGSISLTLFCFILLTLFYSFVSFYKWVNEKYNGYNLITTSGPTLFYGTAEKRTTPLTKNLLLASLFSVPGDKACLQLMDRNDCSFWSLAHTDSLGFKKYDELQASGMNRTEIELKIKELAAEKILGSPFQYLFLTFLDSFRIFFWESTRMGFVQYPDWLQNVFNWTPFKNSLRFLMAVFTFLSLIYTAVVLFKDKTMMNTERKTLLGFILYFILIFSFLHSLFYIITRYIFPIVPLFIILIAFTFSQLLFLETKK